MPADLASFRARFSDFSTSSDEDVQFALDEAQILHSLLDLATLYCAAHILTLDKPSGEEGSNASNEVSQRRVGPMSASYITQAEENWEAFFTSTKYGKRFLALEKRIPRSGIGAMVVG